MVDDDDQLKLARRLVFALAIDLGLEKDLLRRALGRDPTRQEMAERIRARFRSDPSFRRTVMAVKRDIEAETVMKREDLK